MVIGVPKESYPGERRVALTPAVLPGLIQRGLKILVEAGAGAGAGHADGDFEKAGAGIIGSRREIFSAADIIVQVLALNANPLAGLSDLALMRPHQALIAFLRPLESRDNNISALAKARVTGLAVELMPRITRAQSMDALSSMSTVVGYKAVLAAAEALPKMFPMLMTAAGTIKPARIFVIGAGIVGLQAIATARRLGAVVEAYDVRPAVKQEVESLGARFVEIPLETGEEEKAGGYAKAQDETFYRRQQELLTGVIAESDVVITAAVVPGRKAPVLIIEAMVERMAAGSVIVDLAAEQGGNCALSSAGENVMHQGVTIMSPINIASTVPFHASQLYAKNLSTFLLYLIKDGRLRLDRDDPIVRDTLISYDGEIVNDRIREFLQLPPVELSSQK
ncbi:MAG TPA: NAD(P) transhydrogenase subunit alpha [Candidatus Binatia bacterium]|nr:NAD(P) transhydrogenase subunit alpha [Candidatus Binatia bacterium]